MQGRKSSSIFCSGQQRASPWTTLERNLQCPLLPHVWLFLKQIKLRSSFLPLNYWGLIFFFSLVLVQIVVVFVLPGTSPFVPWDLLVVSFHYYVWPGGPVHTSGSFVTVDCGRAVKCFLTEEKQKLPGRKGGIGKCHFWGPPFASGQPLFSQTVEVREQGIQMVSSISKQKGH